VARLTTLLEWYFGGDCAPSIFPARSQDRRTQVVGISAKQKVQHPGVPVGKLLKSRDICTTNLCHPVVSGCAVKASDPARSVIGPICISG
jgi:hypothetical protein